MIERHAPYLGLVDIVAALNPGAGRAELERAVAQQTNTRFAVSFAYGHAGLIASLRALGLTGVDVVLPAYTCTVVADAVVATGNVPIFVDVDLADYNTPVDAIKAAVTPRTQAVIATHMYGYPVDVGAIRAALGDDRILIIEDRAMALPVPSMGFSAKGDLILVSFGPGKHLFTVQGGAIATDSASLYEKIRLYRDREMARLPATQWFKRWLQLLYYTMPPVVQRVKRRWLNRSHYAPTGTPGVALEPASDEADVVSTLVAPDYATACADFQARVGLCQLAKLGTVLERRMRLAEFYTRELDGVNGLVPALITPGASYAHYTVRVQRRDEIHFRELMYGCGVQVGQIYDHVLPFRPRFRRYAREDYPNTQQATRQVVNLPVHPRLTMADAQYVVQCARQILGAG